MYQEERLLKIMEYLNENGSMSVHDICNILNVSRDTARRDILKLIEQGTAIRTHGGISLPVLKNAIKDFRERFDAYSEGKMKIAEKALSFIKDGEHYYFDVSTTVFFLAKSLNKNVSVVTHSLDNIEILSEKENIKVFSTGGALNKNNRFFYGQATTEYFNEMLFDAMFLGAGAIMTKGIYYVDEDDAYVKKAAIKRTAKVIVLASRQKFELFTYYKGADWEDIDVIITDGTPPAVYMNIIKDHDIELIIV